MTTEEIERVFLSLGKGVTWLTITGGEPFLRNDLAKIYKSACHSLNPKIISIATNAILRDAIPGTVEKILAECPDTHLILNVSLDGIGRQHDELRGVNNNFNVAMDTYDKLRAINKPNFTLGINTIISKFNVKYFHDFIHELINLKADTYAAEIAQEKSELNNTGLDIQPDKQGYIKAVSYLKKELKRKKFKGIPGMAQSLRLQYYDLIEKMLQEKKQIVSCYAGIASAYIACDGQVYACCVCNTSFGDLRECGYDFLKIWFSQRAEAARKRIIKDQCFCYVAGINYLNMLFDGKSLLRAGFNFLKLNIR
jgi:MoaA/NifB/PqqE/SkfB family radical SAM enzyme